MKKVFRFVLAGVVLLASMATASAQLVAGFVIGGPQATVDVTNNTDQAVRVVIRNKDFVVGPNGRQVHDHFSSFANRGDIRVDVTLCSANPTRDAIVSAPTNQNFPLGDLAITDAYLATRPNMKDIKQKVDAIEKYIKGQPGAKAFKDELEAWQKSVDKGGLKISLIGCDPQYTFVGKIPWQSASYDSYGDPLFNVTLEQTADGHRQYRSGQYTVSY